MSHVICAGIAEHFERCHDIDLSRYADSRLIHEIPELLNHDWRNSALNTTVYADDSIILLDHKLFYLHIFGYPIYFLLERNSFEFNSINQYISMLSSTDFTIQGKQLLEKKSLHSLLSKAVKNALGEMLFSVHCKWLVEILKTVPGNCVNKVNFDEVDENIMKIGSLSKELCDNNYN